MKVIVGFFITKPGKRAEYLEAALGAARTVESGAIAKATQKLHPTQPSRIAEAIHAARIKAVSDAIARRGQA